MRGDESANGTRKEVIGRRSKVMSTLEQVLMSNRNLLKKTIERVQESSGATDRRFTS
jgi:hypothetical protein